MIALCKMSWVVWIAALVLLSGQMLEATGEESGQSPAGGAGIVMDAPVPAGRAGTSGAKAGKAGAPIGAMQHPTRLRHHPVVKHFVPGHRIQVSLKAMDRDGVREVRCYFRAREATEYVFVRMPQVKRAPLIESLDQLEGQLYRGTLPAPEADVRGIDYLFLVVDGNGNVVKSQVFRAESTPGTKVPAWQESKSKDSVEVFSEMEGDSAGIMGFRDDISADVVESGARFMAVAEGAYIGHAAAVGGAAGTAAGGTAGASAGSTTVAASTAGLGVTAGVGAAAAVAVVAAGSAASGGGGGGGGGDSVTDSGVDISGSWRVDDYCNSSVAFHPGGGLDMVSCGVSASGSWQISGNTLSFSGVNSRGESLSYTGEVSGDNDSFTVSGTFGTFTFYR